MRWPFVSRRRFEALLSAYVANEQALSAAHLRVFALERQVDVVESLRRDEQWRRIKAEGLCAYKDDRVRRVLGLPGFTDDEEGKKSA